MLAAGACTLGSLHWRPVVQLACAGHLDRVVPDPAGHVLRTAASAAYVWFMKRTVAGRLRNYDGAPIQVSWGQVDVSRDSFASHPVAYVVQR